MTTNNSECKKNHQSEQKLQITLTLSNIRNQICKSSGSWVQNVSVRLETILGRKRITTCPCSFVVVRSFWEEQKLRRVLHVTEVRQHHIQVWLVGIPATINEQKPGDLHRPTYKQVCTCK